MLYRVRWALLLLPLIGVLAGTTYAATKPPVYGAQVQLAMGDADTGAQSNQQAASYARLVTLDRVVQQLSQNDLPLVLGVSASPIPDSSMIRVEATATTSQAAVNAAKVAARDLKDQVDVLAGPARAAATLKRFTAMSRQVSALQADVNSGRLSRSAWVDASTKLAQAQAQANALGSMYQEQMRGAANADLSVVRPSTPTGSGVEARRRLYMLIGAGVAGLVGYVVWRLIGPKPLDDDAPGSSFRVPSLRGAADQVRAEPAWAEPARAEPARAEPARAEPARAEPAWAEPARVEPVRLKQRIDLDAFPDHTSPLPIVRPEAARPEAARPEAARPEALRPEAARPEALRPEAARPEALRPEAVLPQQPTPPRRELGTPPPLPSSGRRGLLGLQTERPEGSPAGRSSRRER